jgi:hypothetical protein
MLRILLWDLGYPGISHKNPRIGERFNEIYAFMRINIEWSMEYELHTFSAWMTCHNISIEESLGRIVHCTVGGNPGKFAV